MKEDIKDKLEKLSKEQLLWIIETIFDAEPLSRKSYNLVKYADAPNRLLQAQTGDRGQNIAERQYKQGL